MGKHRKSIAAMAMGMIIIFCAQAQAADLSGLEERVCRLEQCMQKEANLLDGMKLCVGATIVVQGTSNANGSGLNATQNSYKGDDVTDASYSVDIEIEKAFEENGGRAFLYLATGEGLGVTDNIEVYSNVNNDADNSANLTVGEIWWQQDIEDKAVLTFGKIDPTKYIDTNAFANDECSQFLGSMFRNSPVVEFSGNSFGLRTGVPVTEQIEIEAVAVDGNADFSQIGDSLWWSVQMNVKPELMDREGNYRLLYWYNDTAHTQWNDALKVKESASGFGLSFDQEIADKVGVFARAGWQNENVFTDAAGDGVTAEDFSLAAAYSLGAQFGGALWGREKDVCGIGYGIVEPSDEYKKATAGLNAKNENHLELYYNFACNENLSITPDLQVISSPFGKDAPGGNSTIMVAGVRTQINF